MISTNFLSGQGLGNQLWVYAACRGIATHLKMPFSIGGRDCFKGLGFLHIDWGEKGEKGGRAQSDAALGDIGGVAFHERRYYDPDLDYFASSYDDRVERLGPDTCLEGLFQSEEYFYGQGSMLRQWLRLSDETLEKANAYRNLCVLNVRGGEYKRHKNLILPKSYWVDGIRNIRKKTGVDQFLIVTDDPAYGRALLPDIPVLEGGIADCYAALHGAHCHVLSNSSFSYFPIKTRIDKPYVIAPYLWSRFNNPFNRWASPANLYEHWQWLDPAGAVKSYDECQQVARMTKEYYQDNYWLLAPMGAVPSKNIGAKIPQFIKKPLRKILSRLLPLYI